MDPLSQLQDIRLPDPVPFWPPAPGWWLVALIILLVLTYLLRRIYRLWQRKTVAKLALKQLQACHLKYLKTNNRLEYTQQVNILMKQVALGYHHPDTVARLNGNAWLAFLDSTGKTTDFSQGPARALASAPYGDSQEFDTQQLLKCCQTWIRKQP